MVTTLSIVAGVRGAGLSSFAVLALGFANLAADGLSMAAFAAQVELNVERLAATGYDAASPDIVFRVSASGSVAWGFR